MAGRPEGLTIAPIGQGSYGRPKPRPTLTEEDIAEVWNINVNKLLESTKQNVKQYGPEAIMTKNISWANKPNKSNKSKTTTKRKAPNNFEQSASKRMAINSESNNSGFYTPRKGGRTLKRKNRKQRKTYRRRK
jgi:hypothetical protein